MARAPARCRSSRRSSATGRTTRSPSRITVRSRCCCKASKRKRKPIEASYGRGCYTGRMRSFLFVVLVLSASYPLGAQERPVPKDSSRISIPGCAKGRTFIVAARGEAEPVRSDVQPGSRFRLSGSKKLLEEIKKQEKQGSMVEVTGLVRKSQLAGPGGVPIAGGRIRIGGGVPRDPIYSDPARDPRYNEAIID